ncbi:MAG: ATP-binding cassette domain-containing protein [Enterocloster clostridioformis]
MIRDLNIKVREHEVVAVAGSSGSGKSLLPMRSWVFCRRMPACQGTVFLRGNPEPEAEGTAPGKPDGTGTSERVLSGSADEGGERVRRGQKDKESVKRCRESLGRYGLGEDTEGLYPFELSGGMTRRVLISTAVMEHPRLVIADEPTPGLSYQSGQACAQTISGR